jgi:5-methylcytosine-specific restriction protein A
LAKIVAGVSWRFDLFTVGSLYRRRDLHEKYGGQRQGGISTPARYPFIMIFTGESGSTYGYQDGWLDDRTFLYTGEGQRSDMEFVRGNRAIRDHVKDGKAIHLFEQASKGYVRYLGQMAFVGYRVREATDVDRIQRRAIVFELTRVDE